MHNKLLLFLLLFLCTGFHAGDVNVQVEEITTNNNFKFLFMENHDLPVVYLDITFKNSGYAYDSQKKQGLATFVSAFLHEGAGSSSVLEFARKLENKGIELSSDVSKEYFHVHLKTLSENLPDAMSLLSDYLLRPNLDDNGFNRAKEMQTVLIKKLDNDPQFVAKSGLKKLLFDEHPYAKAEYGLLSTIANIMQDDVLQYVRRNFNQEKMVISVVGSANSQELSELIDNYLLQLPTKAEESARKIESANLNLGKSNHTFMDIPQSIVFFGQEGVAIDDPNYYRVYLLNYALGGMSLNSVLMHQLRDKLGITYHISTFLDINEHSNILGGVLFTDNSTAAQAISAIKQVFNEIKEKGISSKSFEDAKTNIINSFIFSLSNNDNIIHYLTKIQLHNFKVDYINNYINYFEKITLKDVNNTARSLLSADNLSFFEVSKKNSFINN
ncbi:pitrilysin family protein [Candidatus Mesenet endosymbiont of Agriotes lineatus]|uniref:M16 family metallopeptidase n=1 Tax=Candidatus Mesenet endosymbiont of Agriotes lineatus TaxID=3077948 RepID=UPI0030CD8BCB